MVPKLSLRMLLVIFRRRAIKISLIACFLLVSIGLMVKLQYLSQETNLDMVVKMDTGSFPVPSADAVIERHPADNPFDSETNQARKRFAEIGVDLIPVRESNLNNLKSFLIDDSDKLFVVPPNSSIKHQHWDESKSEPTFGSDVKREKQTGNNAHPDFSILPQDKRETTKEPTKYVFLVILVISLPNNVQLRQAARKTWATDAKYFGVLVRFVVGRMEEWDGIIDREQTIHSDMIIVEDQDTYESLPNKVVEGFKWAIQHPSKPPFIMKADDDTIINIPYLVSELFTRALNSTQILGAIRRDVPVVRDPGDRWAVSLLDFPFPTYPPYASGGGYVLSSKCAKTLLSAKSSTDWLHLEDVYITGILARKSGISHVSHTGFSFWKSAKASPCDFIQRKRMTSINHSEHEIFALYEKIQAILRTGHPLKRCEAITNSRTRSRH